MTTMRSNQSTLTSAQWNAFVDAINALHGVQAASPAYRVFVQTHVDAMSMSGMPWGVHTMPQMGMVGRNFLAWHRHFLLRLEERLQQVDASVSLPYWDWIADRQIPSQLDDPALLESWSVTRNWDPSQLPTEAEVAAVLARRTFTTFQRSLELGPHDKVHVAVGGTMDGASSPADPIFWLHHANLDRIWSEWQTTNPTSTPDNGDEQLEPASLFDVTVASQLDVNALGYQYVN